MKRQNDWLKGEEATTLTAWLVDSLIGVFILGCAEVFRLEIF